MRHHRTMQTSDDPSRPWRRRAVVLVVVLAGALVSWARLPEDVRGVVWAEDGRLFLQQRLDQGAWSSLVISYDGYQHLVPRLVTDLVVLVAAPGAYAVVLTATCCAVVGLVAGAVHLFARPRLRSDVASVGLALVVVLVPVAPLEVLGNVANLHWYFLFLLPFALLFRPATTRGTVGQSLALVLAALTEVQAVLFLPLVLLGVRHRRSWPGLAAFVVAVALQVWSTLTFPRVRGQAPPLGADDVALGYLAQPVTSLVSTSAREASVLLGEHGWRLPVAVLVVVAVAWVTVLAARRSPRSTLALVLLVAGPVLWATDVVLNRSPLTEYGEDGAALLEQAGYLRYAVVPAALLLCGLPLAADRLIDASRPGVRALAAVPLAALLAVAVVGGVPDRTTRTDGPDWSRSVQQVVADCRDDAPEGRILGAPAGWDVVVDCVVLVEEGRLAS